MDRKGNFTPSHFLFQAQIKGFARIGVISVFEVRVPTKPCQGGR